MPNIRISLLPADLKKESEVIRRWTLFALILAIIAMVILAGSFLFNATLKGPKSELESLIDQNSLYTDSISRLSYIEELFDATAQDKAILSDLMGSDLDWEFVYRQMSNNITLYDINVVQLVVSRVAGSPNALIIGECSSLEELIAWTNSTSDLPGIDSFDLVETSLIDGNGEDSMFSFEVRMNINQWAE